MNTNLPSESPTNIPTSDPTTNPTKAPTNIPIASPTMIPTKTPTIFPSIFPSIFPTNTPTNIPTGIPTNTPTNIQTDTPSYLVTTTSNVLTTYSPTNITSNTTQSTSSQSNITRKIGTGIALLVISLLLIVTCIIALCVYFIKGLKESYHGIYSEQENSKYIQLMDQDKMRNNSMSNYDGIYKHTNDKSSTKVMSFDDGEPSLNIYDSNIELSNNNETNDLVNDLFEGQNNHLTVPYKTPKHSPIEWNL